MSRAKVGLPKVDPLHLVIFDPLDQVFKLLLHAPPPVDKNGVYSIFEMRN
jgi:hypothetical protein